MKHRLIKRSIYLFFFIFSIVLIIGVALAGESILRRNAVSAAELSDLKSYLTLSNLPNSLLLLPPPPGQGSILYELDQYISRSSLELQGTPRWDLAASDADLSLPHAAGTFSCALDAPITAQDTPTLYKMLRDISLDAAKSTLLAKLKYMRPRPFMINNEPTCRPVDEALLRKDGAYPSGHTAMGWACALVLSELAPDRAEKILARGRAFGQSRVVCNVHWQSDVSQGFTMGAATVQRLKQVPRFLADFETARAEIVAVRGKGLPPTRDCQLESTALNF